MNLEGYCTQLLVLLRAHEDQLVAVRAPRVLHMNCLAEKMLNLILNHKIWLTLVLWFFGPVIIQHRTLGISSDLIPKFDDKD